jgi:hypothetical protein
MPLEKGERGEVRGGHWELEFGIWSFDLPRGSGFHEDTGFFK